MRTSINFSKKYSKLDRSNYHTVRWNDFDVSIGKSYEIYLVADNMFHNKYGKGKMRCIKLELKKIKELSDEFILEDADCKREQFMKMMEGWYSKKPNWKGEDSEIIVIFLEKVE